VASHRRIIDPAQERGDRQRYNGINVLALWATAQERAYTHSLWGTYKQFQSLDAQVRKGEKAALVIFYKEYDAEPDP
jgi:antirestriction protein ArdC